MKFSEIVQLPQLQITIYIEIKRGTKTTLFLILSEHIRQ